MPGVLDLRHRDAPVSQELSPLTERLDFDDLRRALDLRAFDAVSAQRRMAPIPRRWTSQTQEPKCAAVMLLVFSDARQRLQVVLTLRNADLRGHSGQVSFPGGQQDAADPSPFGTALRETVEEIGICAAKVSPLGALADLYIPVSNFLVQPVVAGYDGIPQFTPDPREVAAVFTFALEDLLCADFKCQERRRMRGADVRVPFYAVAGHKVWGATAMMLSELEGRLRCALSSPLRAAG